MRTEHVFISPEKAEAFLATNASNRPLNITRAMTLAAEMNSGRWDPDNAETIKISKTGKLLDGQHRMLAIMEHKKPVKMLIAYDVPDKSFETIDTGRSRSALDIAGMGGYHNPAVVTAGAALLWRVYHGISVREACPANYVMEVLKRYPAFNKWAKFVAPGEGARGGLPATAKIAALVYLDTIAQKPTVAETFYAKITKGAGLSDGSPYLALRNRMMSARGSGIRLDVTNTWAPTVRTIDAIEQGEELFRVQLPTAQDKLVRPVYWDEHMANLPRSFKLDDLQPGDRKKRTSVAELVAELHAVAEAREQTQGVA